MFHEFNKMNFIKRFTVCAGLFLALCQIPVAADAQIVLETSIGPNGEINPGHKDFGTIDADFRYKLYESMYKDAVVPVRAEAGQKNSCGAWEMEPWLGTRFESAVSVDKVVLRFSLDEKTELGKVGPQRLDVAVEYTDDGVWFSHNNSFRRKVNKVPGVLLKNDSLGWKYDYYEGGEEDGMVLAVYGTGEQKDVPLVGVCPRGRYTMRTAEKGARTYLIENGYRLIRVLSGVDGKVRTIVQGVPGEVVADLSILTGPETSRSEQWEQRMKGVDFTGELIYTQRTVEQLPVENFKKRTLGLGIEVAANLDLGGGMSARWSRKNTVYIDEVFQKREHTWVIKDYRGKELVVSPGVCYLLYRETEGENSCSRPPPTPTAAFTQAAGSNAQAVPAGTEQVPTVESVTPAK